MTTITWKISQLDRNTADGFVTTAHWICSGEDGEHSASVYASASFDGSLSTPYASLTEQQVLGWVWQQVDKAATEAAVAAQIAEQKAPKTAAGLPWQA